MPHLKANLIVAFALFNLITVSPSHGSDTSVTGTVLFRGTGEAGAYVEVFDRPLAPGLDPLASTNSGAGGVFTLQLPEGKYHFSAKKRPGGMGSAGMLFGTTGEEPLAVSGSAMDLPPIVLTDSGGSGGDPGGEVEVSGLVSHLGEPLAGAFVYAYRGNQRRGPGYVGRVRSGRDGRFLLNLPSGPYTITVRSSGRGEGMGTVEASDLIGEVPGDPVQVRGPAMDVGTVDLRRVDRAAWRDRKWAASEAGLAIRGVIVNEEGRPAAGIYAFVYDDQRMVGKPLAISAPTGEDGIYSVAVPGPGTYYVGARSRYGGPVEPGEKMGAYDTDGIRPVDLHAGQVRDGCDIVVREVW